MPKFIVSVPLTGAASFEVEASSAVEAKELAWEAIDSGQEPDVVWEYCERVTTGNVSHAYLNEVDVVKVSD